MGIAHRTLDGVPARNVKGPVTYSTSTPEDPIDVGTGLLERFWAPTSTAFAGEEEIGLIVFDGNWYTRHTIRELAQGLNDLACEAFEAADALEQSQMDEREQRPDIRREQLMIVVYTNLQYNFDADNSFVEMS